MAMTDSKRILAGTSKYSSNIKLHLPESVYQQLMVQLLQMRGKGQYDGTY